MLTTILLSFLTIIAQNQTLPQYIIDAHQNYTVSTSNTDCIFLSFTATNDVTFRLLWDSVTEINSYTGKDMETRYDNLDSNYEYTLLFGNNNNQQLILEYILRSCDTQVSSGTVIGIVILFTIICLSTIWCIRSRCCNQNLEQTVLPRFATSSRYTKYNYHTITSS